MSVGISCVKLNYSSFSREHTLACSAHFNDTVAFFAFSKPPFLLALICLYFWFYSWSATVTMLPSGCLLNLCKNTSSLPCPACWSRMEYSQIHHSWHVHVVCCYLRTSISFFKKPKKPSTPLTLTYPFMKTPTMNLCWLQKFHALKTWVYLMDLFTLSWSICSSSTASSQSLHTILGCWDARRLCRSFNW